MTPLEEAIERTAAAVEAGNGLRQVMEATQHPEGTTDDSPSLAWILRAANNTTMIVEWGWHMDGGAWVKVQKFDAETGDELALTDADDATRWSPPPAMIR